MPIGWSPMADSAMTISWLRRWRHPSVRARITLAAVLVTAVAMGAAGWLLVRSVREAQINELRDDVEANVDRVATRLRAGADPTEAVEAATASVGIVVVTDERGELVAASASPLVPAVSAATGPVPADDPAAGDFELADAASGVGRGLGPEIQLFGSRTVSTASGRLTVSGAAPVAEVDRSIVALRRALMFGLPALVALVAAVAYTLVGRALRPVEAIRAEVDAISGSTMHRRVPEPPTNDEIARLARTMNAMLDRLDTSATRQRQFVADASHELRSPVAAIRTGLEVARRKADRANWPAVADTALAEESKLEGLLDDLLLLAKHDENGATALRPEPVNLEPRSSAPRPGAPTVSPSTSRSLPPTAQLSRS